MAWMLQLEDQRILKLPEPPPPPVVAPVKGKRPAPLPPPPASVPDLTKLASRSDPRVRRRAAIAIGRVGLPEAVPALTHAARRSPIPTSGSPRVRARPDRRSHRVGGAPAAAPGSRSARRAAAPPKALGLMGAEDAAPAIAKMTAAIRGDPPAVTAMTPDDERWPATAGGRGVQAGACSRSSGLRAYDSLAAAALRPTASRSRPGGRSPTRCSAIGDPRAAAGAPAAHAREGPIHAGVRRARSRPHQGQRRGRRAAAAARSRDPAARSRRRRRSSRCAIWRWRRPVPGSARSRPMPPSTATSAWRR